MINSEKNIKMQLVWSVTLEEILFFLHHYYYIHQKTYLNDYGVIFTVIFRMTIFNSKWYFSKLFENCSRPHCDYDFNSLFNTVVWMTVSFSLCVGWGLIKYHIIRISFDCLIAFVSTNTGFGLRRWEWLFVKTKSNPCLLYTSKAINFSNSAEQTQLLSLVTLTW